MQDADGSRVLESGRLVDAMVTYAQQVRLDAVRVDVDREQTEGHGRERRGAPSTSRPAMAERQAQPQDDGLAEDRLAHQARADPEPQVAEVLEAGDRRGQDGGGTGEETEPDDVSRDQGQPGAAGQPAASRVPPREPRARARREQHGVEQGRRQPEPGGRHRRRRCTRRTTLKSREDA